MNVQAPTPEQRLFLSNHCLQYDLSIQTHHNAIAILMDVNLPEYANHDADVITAALFISHKIHDTHKVSLSDFCPFKVNVQSVLQMQSMILRQLKYKDVFEWAHLWDKFVEKLTCVDVNFFKNKSGYIRSLMFELVEKMMYESDLWNFQFRKLSAAIIYICIKQSIKQKDKKKAFNRTKLADFIFDDFLKDVTENDLNFLQLKSEIKAVKNRNMVLRNITNIQGKKSILNK